MIKNLDHLLILKNYKDYVNSDPKAKGNIEIMKVWLADVVNCFENSVYNGEVTNTKLIAELSSFINSYNITLKNHPTPQEVLDHLNNADILIDRSVSPKN